MMILSLNRLTGWSIVHGDGTSLGTLNDLLVRPKKWTVEALVAQTVPASQLQYLSVYEVADLETDVPRITLAGKKPQHVFASQTEVERNVGYDLVSLRSLRRRGLQYKHEILGLIDDFILADDWERVEYLLLAADGHLPEINRIFEMERVTAIKGDHVEITDDKADRFDIPASRLNNRQRQDEILKGLGLLSA